ncbi:MAG TPA: hypothetical protein VGN48_14760, partial [Pedococcus sp.]|nr:hypothetical protein [Pedococcus sp.]
MLGHPMKRTIPMTLLACAAVASLGSCGSGAATSSSPASAASAGASTGAPGVVALPKYRVAVFAKASSAYSNPDSITRDGNNVFVAYQNHTAKDGTDTRTSTVVQYDLTGHVVKTFAVAGHNDGLKVDPSTHLVWAMSNEDASPKLTTIDVGTGAKKEYTFSKTAHGGGFDDIVFAGGKTYLSASNPTLKGNVNSAPAVVTATLGSGTVQTTPVLIGNATAKDALTGAAVTINAVDPDSMFVDPAGDLTLDNQGGTALISIHNPGPGQTVKQLTVGTQVDDTVYPGASTGRLLVSDTKAGVIYAISGALDPAT